MTPPTGSHPPRAQALAALALGSLTMVVTALQPLLLSDLADTGRLSPVLVHPAAILEMLAMAGAVAACALLLPPKRLRLLGTIAALVGVTASLCELAAHDGQFLVLRTLAGAASGVLIWIAVGMIARQPRPEPWAAAFFLIQSAGQVFAAGLVASLLGPRFGPAGGVGLAAGLSAVAVAAALLCPPSLPDLARSPDGRRPGRKGLIALAALFLYFAGNAIVWYQMRPLAAAQELGEISGPVVLATLVGQMLGALAALALAAPALVERTPPRRLFTLVAGLGLLAIAGLAVRPPAALFVAAFGLAAFAALLLGASLFGVLNAADASRRAGAVSPAAQLTAAALGPLLGMTISGTDPRASLLLAAGCMLAALACAGFSLRPDESASPDCG